jgi:hypothetical protein
LLIFKTGWSFGEGQAMESTGVYWKPVYAVLEGGALETVVAGTYH